MGNREGEDHLVEHNTEYHALYNSIYRQTKTLLSLRIGQNVNTLWNNPIQVCIAYFNKLSVDFIVWTLGALLVYLSFFCIAPSVCLEASSRLFLACRH